MAVFSSKSLGGLCGGIAATSGRKWCAVALLAALALAAVGYWMDNLVLASLSLAVALVLAARLARSLLRRKETVDGQSSASPASNEERVARHSSRRPQDPDDPDSLVDEMLHQERYALLLRPQVAGNLSPKQLAAAQEALEENMSLVPEGVVYLHQPDEANEDDDEDAAPGGRLVRVEPALLDCFPITNAQYKCFVAAGGYEEFALWDPQVWPGVFDFVDRTGEFGPRFWKHGTFAPGEDDHPVVGVCWYEAMAYARWVGKRLPSDAEWVKAGCWPMPTAGGPPAQRKFPWGDNWEPQRANIWGTGPGHTTPVTQFDAGASVAGVYGLIGNVWEWTMEPFGLYHNSRGHDDAMRNLKSIRGGAFDTYFETQATCQFQSGDSPLARKHNIGFRCALGVCDLAEDAPAETDEEENTAAYELVGEST